MIKTATFIGHKEAVGVDRSKLEATIEELIVHQGCIEFLCGGMGGFDELCARTVWESKKAFSHVKSLLVIPYLFFQYKTRRIMMKLYTPPSLKENFSSVAFCSAINILSTTHRPPFATLTIRGAAHTQRIYTQKRKGFVCLRFNLPQMTAAGASPRPTHGSVPPGYVRLYQIQMQTGRSRVPA